MSRKGEGIVLEQMRDVEPDEENRKRVETSYELEADRWNNTKLDLSQKRALKSTAVVVGCAVSVFMALMLLGALFHMTDSKFSDIEAPVAVAIVAGPMISITSVTIFLLIGVFRKFDEKDFDALANTLSKAAKTGSTGGD